MKTCNKCKIAKEELEFVFKCKEKNIRQSICKECQKTYKLKHYYQNKEAHYKRNKKTENIIRDYINSVKIQGCSLCDEKEISCMDFHHLKDKNDEIAKMAKKGSLEKVKKEIKKCIVLCANCHRKLHAGLIAYPVA